MKAVINEIIEHNCIILVNITITIKLERKKMKENNLNCNSNCNNKINKKNQIYCKRKDKKISRLQWVFGNLKH